MRGNMHASLPFDYDNLGEALSYVENPSQDHRSFRPRGLDNSGDAPSAPTGTFYDKSGRVISTPRRAEPPTPGNEYGFLLNRYGEWGDRRVWLAYTSGTRQAF